LNLGLVSLEEVVITNGVVALRAKPDWMVSFLDMTTLVEVFPLPLDELAVLGINSREPAPPIYGEATGAHHPLVLIGKMADDRERIHELLQGLGWNFVEVAVEADGFLVTSGYPLRDTD